jgi:hypothetical protein
VEASAAGGSGTVPRDGRLQVQFQVGFLNFSSHLFLLSEFNSHGSIKRRANMATKAFSWGKVRPTRRPDRSAVLVVPIVNIKMEAQYFISPLSLHDDLRDSFTLPYVLNVVQSVTSGYTE